MIEKETLNRDIWSPPQNPMILDAGADKAKIRNVLTKLHNRMEELQKRAFMYKSYQKNFKVR